MGHKLFNFNSIIKLYKKSRLNQILYRTQCLVCYCFGIIVKAEFDGSSDRSGSRSSASVEASCPDNKVAFVSGPRRGNVSRSVGRAEPPAGSERPSVVRAQLDRAPDRDAARVYRQPTQLSAGERTLTDTDAGKSSWILSIRRGTSAAPPRLMDTILNGGAAADRDYVRFLSTKTQRGPSKRNMPWMWVRFHFLPRPRRRWLMLTLLFCVPYCYERRSEHPHAPPQTNTHINTIKIVKLKKTLSHTLLVEGSFGTS